MRRLARVFAALALVVASARAQPAGRVTVDLEPREITVGDAAVATLRVELPPGAASEISPPDWTKGWGEAEVLASMPAVARTAGGGSEITITLRLTAFKVGEVTLPPIGLGCAEPDPDWCRTPAGITLQVRSVLPAAPAGEKPPEPKPAQPPRPLRVPTSFWWAAGALALACLAAAIAVARRPRAPGAAATKPAELPLPELLAALAGLTALEPIAGAQRLSSVYRRYLGRVFRFPAVESTTSEIHRQLLGRALDPAIVRRSVQLLRDADQVKFAKRPFGRAELEAQASAARELAEAIERHLSPPAPGPPTQARPFEASA